MAIRDECPLQINIIRSSDEVIIPLCRKYGEGKFPENYSPTIGVDVTIKRMQIEEQNFKFLIWTVSSKAVFGKIRPNYFEGSFSCIFVFDKSDRKSFTAVRKYHKEFITPERRDAPYVVLGLKTGTEEIPHAAGETLAKTLYAQYYEMTPDDQVTYNKILIEIGKKYLRWAN